MKDSGAWKPLLFLPLYGFCWILTQVAGQETSLLYKIVFAVGAVWVVLFFIQNLHGADEQHNNIPYVKPKITAVRKSVAEVHGQLVHVGEFDVAAQHGDHVIRELSLPTWGTEVLRMGGDRFIVRFQLPANILDSDRPQGWHDDNYIRMWAQANGWKK